MNNQRGSVDFDHIRYAIAGTIIYPPGGKYGPRIQSDLQLVLLHSGEMRVEIDGKALDVTPGSVVLLKPGRHECFSFSKTGESWHRWISVHMAFRSPEEQALFEQLPVTIPISEELNRLADVMLSLQLDHSADSEVMRSLGMSALLLYISEMGRSRALEEIHPSVLMAKAMIHRSYHEDLELGQLAAYASVSPEHLVRLFRAGEQTTPIKYLWNYRVLRALEFLAYTGLPITEVAYRCGFKSTFHFARMIKAQTGKTPTQIRADAWKGHRM